MLLSKSKFNTYVKFVVKEKQREKLEEIAITTVNAECSAIIMNKVPEKLEDPGKFLIPCALQELDRTTLTPTRMTLELANRSLLTNGIAEDVVLELMIHYLLRDYCYGIILNRPEVPIIYGTFLRTAKTLIDMLLTKKPWTLRMGKELCLTPPPTLEVSSSNPTSPTLDRKSKQKPKPFSRLKKLKKSRKRNEVSTENLINTIVMPIKITFDNPIDFNHFSKPKDFKKDLTISFDSTKTSIFPSPLLDSDSPFTAELSASITLNSLGKRGTKYSNPVY
ncbi:hypothetical protein Tco_1361887 [Tanacetum coccineum]